MFSTESQKKNICNLNKEMPTKAQEAYRTPNRLVKKKEPSPHNNNNNQNKEKKC